MSGRRFDALDGLRGLGSLFVMAGHTQWHGETILPGAALWMDVFFAMSGFLITGLLVGEHDATGRIALGRFYQRRAIRLLPALYAFVFIESLLYFATKAPILGGRPLLSIASTTFYFSNWVGALGTDLGVFTQTWSLSIEEQFYVTLPIVLTLFLRPRERRLAAAVFAAGIVAVIARRIAVYDATADAVGHARAWRRCFFGSDTHADSIFIGCLGGLFARSRGKERLRVPAWLGWTAALAILLGTFLRDLPALRHHNHGSPTTTFLMDGGFALAGVVAMIMILHLTDYPSGLLARFLSKRVLVALGLMAYSLYLWHPAAFGFIDIVLESWARSPLLFAAKTVIRTLLALGVARVSFLVAERPFLSKKVAPYRAVPEPITGTTSPRAVS